MEACLILKEKNIIFEHVEMNAFPSGCTVHFTSYAQLLHDVYNFSTGTGN
jgi:hypothetical protein